MENLANKIFESVERWNLSFETLGFLFDMDKETVRNIYHKERKRRELSKRITLDSDFSVLSGTLLSTRTANLIRRLSWRRDEKPCKTIREFLDFDARSFIGEKQCGKNFFGEIESAKEYLKEKING